MKRRVPLTLLPMIVAACSSSSPVRLPDGEWGGRNLDLIVEEMGASGSFKCGARGRIDQPLTLDESGAFDLPGTYDPAVVAGGPRAARYVGAMSGTTLQVTVSVEGNVIGTFQLAQGRAASFDVCNF